MTEFLQTALTFPTLLYSILLAFCTIYWLLAATGLVDMEAIDGLLSGDGGGDSHHHATDSAGLLARLGLGGVPIMIVLTVLAFFGWMITYFMQLLALQHLPAPLRLLGGIATLVGALIPGVFVTSLLLRPVRKLMVKLRPPVAPSILGRVGTVISPEVDGKQGRAEFADGGAGLILQVRITPPGRFVRGDRVVLLEHDATANTYLVISESQFNAH
ncbi:OB-fold-containig protein [Thermomonas carbonis]|uniref:DUF1449 family protein n=1 Tax=Thermomonas carbonis TaxID=1463158 RepID=A0A7G9SQZ5_9GAMM|nr:OB-fold-containig protein [Thermomonas carbonis]QNN70270.1 DUF1449 family protein [Thermomonas carbonis]GHB98897.1 hypothetical protein GCM10010080_09370 [Thermomonas carbonis]